MSSGEGAGLPDGWLCAHMIDAAERFTASRKISLGWTMLAIERLKYKIISVNIGTLM
jgi:hypothetical protein